MDPKIRLILWITIWAYDKSSIFSFANVKTQLPIVLISRLADFRGNCRLWGVDPLFPDQRGGNNSGIFFWKKYNDWWDISIDSYHMDGSVQYCSISIANAQAILQSFKLSTINQWCTCLLRVAHWDEKILIWFLSCLAYTTATLNYFT